MPARLETASVWYEHSSYRQYELHVEVLRSEWKSYTVRLDSTVFESSDTESP